MSEFIRITRFRRIFPVSALFMVLLLGSCATVVGDTFEPSGMEPYIREERYLVGVLSFQNTTDMAELSDPGSGFSGVMIDELQEYKRFRLIEGERVQSLLEEQRFQLSGMVDEETVQEMGKLLGVEALCFTTVDSCSYDEGRTTALIAWIDRQSVELGVNSRIVDVSTGEILAAAETTVTRGRKLWVAFWFMKMGGFTDRETLIYETMDLAVRKLSEELSLDAPRK